jgi:tetratricopeptide (TPR) repeat protein
MVVAGCSSGGGAARLEKALAAYETGYYLEAHDHAVAAQTGLHGAERDRAAYIAGVSAYQMRNIDEAERRLTAATASTDPEVAGRAKATLGLVRMEQGRSDDAAQLFKSAARLLPEPEASEAAYRAGVAHQESGDWSSARTQFTIASSRLRGEPLADAARDGMRETGFSLQVGAFVDLQNARRATAEYQSVAERERLGPVRMVTQADQRGRTLYIVQFGHFGTREAAERTLDRLGNSRLIVAPAAAGS